MISYEVLDNIADSYIPLLAILWFILVVHIFINRQWYKSLLWLMFGINALLIAYGIMWLDNVYALWSSIGLDYSTHTAVSFSLAIVVSCLSKKLRIPVMSSLLAYILLMLYQKYHSVTDIFTTLAALLIPLGLLVYLFFFISKRIHRFSPQ